MKLSLRILAVVTALFSVPALAYIDPGSGSTLISAIVGLFVAIGMAVKTYWYKIQSFFKKDK